MRRVLYGLAWVAMVGGALALGLLPRITLHWLWFGFIGAVLSGIVAGGWVLAGATAGAWPRPRTGWALIAGGSIGMVSGLVDFHLLSLLWALGELISGVLLIVRLFPATRWSTSPRPGTVQAPPVSRRNAGR